jgi:hypothetical protein
MAVFMTAPAVRAGYIAEQAVVVAQSVADGVRVMGLKTGL